MVMKKLPQRPVDNSVPRKSFEERIKESRQNRLREEALAETKESMDEIVDGDATLQGDDSIVQDVVNESFPTSIKFPRHQARKAAGTEKGNHGYRKAHIRRRDRRLVPNQEAREILHGLFGSSC